MNETILQILSQAQENWQPPEVPDDIPQGDMPGDKVWIGPQSIQKAQRGFPSHAAHAAGSSGSQSPPEGRHLGHRRQRRE